MNQQQQQFRHITYLADRSGTGVWRQIWPQNLINCVAQGLNIQADYSQTPIIDQNYYKGMNSITVQRWISDQQANLFTKFFKPLMDANTGWLIYEIDDLMFDGTILDESRREFIENKYGKKATNSIPFYNRGRKAFEGKQVQSNITQMLQTADFITVTTDFLKEVYHDIYGVPLENIIALPNLLPKYLFGDRYEPNKKVKQFEKAKPKNKLRIGIVSSLSHFNIDNVRIDENGKATREQKMPDGSSKWMNEDNVEVPFEKTFKIEDDFDEIAQAVRATVNDFEWVCFGYCPPQIKDLADAKKIQVFGGVPIMNYPSMLENLQLQAVVAPIAKTTFNKSKSFIKYMECAAIGVPLFATDCLPYNRIMPKDQLFDDGNNLKSKLYSLKCMSSDSYKSMIERQWTWLNAPCKEGDFNIKNFWMEDNLNIYIDMIRMRSKTLQVSFNGFVQQYEARKQKQKENTIFDNGNVMITK